jgi:hypothetical protein
MTAGGIWWPLCITILGWVTSWRNEILMSMHPTKQTSHCSCTLGVLGMASASNCELLTSS